MSCSKWDKISLDRSLDQQLTSSLLYVMVTCLTHGMVRTLEGEEGEELDARDGGGGGSVKHNV